MERRSGHLEIRDDDNGDDDDDDADDDDDDDEGLCQKWRIKLIFLRHLQAVQNLDC